MKMESKIRILFLSANPIDSAYLENIKEYKNSIDNIILRTEYRDEFTLEQAHEVSLSELCNYLQRFKPTIVHFTGHGSIDGALVFQNSISDRKEKAPVDTIEELFRIINVERNIKAVVLSACYSKVQAQAISKYVPCVISMKTEISPQAAIAFNRGFYSGLGSAYSLQCAFDAGCLQIRSEKLQQEKIPEIKFSENYDYVGPETILVLSEKLNPYLKDKIDELADNKSDHFGNKLKVKYIEERDALYLDVKNDWYSDDDRILDKYGDDKNTNARKLIDNLIESTDHRFLFVAAPFGIGKSVLAKKIFSEYAYKCLNDSKERYIPIFAPLKEGLNAKFYKDFSLRYLLENIVAYRKADRKILLILDSLDQYEYEYHGNLDELYDRLTDLYLDKYINMKIILTCRLNSSIPKAFHIENQKYIRLLPFTEKQSDQFFKDNDLDLTYDVATNDYGIKRQELTKPLLALMLLKVFPIIKDDLQYIRNDKSITSNMYKALIYFNFLSGIKDGEQIEIDGEKEIDLSRYRDDQIALRTIALLKRIYKGDLTSAVVKKLAEAFGLRVNTLNPNSPILKYSSNNEESIIDFEHSSFEEYLIAENCLELLLNEKNSESIINVGKPSSETINFLEGLIHMIMSANENIKKFIERSDERVISLFNSFNLPERIEDIEDIKQKIIDNAINNVTDESITVLFNQGDEIKDKKISWAKAEENIEINEYRYLWIHRWISLYILQKLNVINRPDVCRKLGLATDTAKNKKKRTACLEKISRLLKLTASILPTEIKKLNNLDLSGIDLAGVDLCGADLSGAKLCGANLYGANLKYAVLSNHACLSECNLSNVNFFNADLTGADLSNSILLRADLSGVKLEYANLVNANISDANISDAKLAHANLTSADLYRANLCDTKLIESHLDKAKLSYAILSYADLSGATLNSTILSYANLSDADLYKAVLSGATLDKTNISNSNLYNAVFDKENLSEVYGEDLANFDDEIITTIPDNHEQIRNNSFIMVFYAKPIPENESFDTVSSRFVLTKFESLKDIKCEVSISENRKIAIFRPMSPLEHSTKYIASIADSSGNIKKKWEFITSEPLGKNSVYSIAYYSGHDGNLPDNVKNSNLTTRWSSYGKGSYITADLGTVKSICAVDIGWFKGNRRQYFFRIATSSDDPHDLLNVVYKDGRSSGKTLCPERYKFEQPDNARYVTVIIDGNTLNNWASITSMNLYEMQQTTC